MAILAAARPPFANDLIERSWRPTLLVAALALGAAARLTYGRHMPLWFDETFTGVIAGQPDAARLWHWLRTELTGPFFYAPMWLWARVAGVSTEALRLPSLLWTLLAPLLVLGWGHRDATMRLIWAVLLLLWLPTAVFAGDARPYALLVLLGTLQAGAFCALLREPTRATALRWVLPTLLMGLTHYYALVTGLLQGVMLLAIHRRRVLALWPAALPFALLAGWMALHLPFVAAVAGDGMALTPTFGWATAWRLPGLIVGDERFALLLALPLAWMLVEQSRGATLRGWRPGAEAWTGIAGVGGVLLLYAIGWVVPGIALRYFVPTLPAAIFGLAWWLTSAVRRGGAAAAAFLGSMLVASAGLTASSWGDTSLDQRHAFGTDLASRYIVERPMNRLLFFWADTTADLAPELKLDANVAEVGGFFVRRAGVKVPVDVIHLPYDADAAAAVMARAAAEPGTAILWVGNRPSDDPLRRPTALMRDARWECRDFGQGLAVSVGCRPRYGCGRADPKAKQTSDRSPANGRRTDGDGEGA